MYHFWPPSSTGLLYHRMPKPSIVFDPATPLCERVLFMARGAVKMVKIDVDQNQDLAAQFRIQSVPSVFAFKDGQPVDGFAGALPESQIKDFIQRLTGDPHKHELVAPMWALEKNETVALIRERLVERDTWQGKRYLKP